MKYFLGIGFVVLFMILIGTSLLGQGVFAQAQQQAVYEFLSSSVGAGGTAVSGRYEVDAIIGQAAVGSFESGRYESGSGFWGGGPVTWLGSQSPVHANFLPILIR
jgi:hypothetical protein